MNQIFQQVLDSIPDYQVFLTMDELDDSSRRLAQQFPQTVSIFEIGKTRENDPLLCLKIGQGSKNALVFGLPHPNEPIGTMMLEHFTWSLAQNEQLRRELDYTWYIVKAWDRDGAKKNEGWFKGPFTITNYMRHFFRPAGFEQVDWTFPIDYKELHFHKPIPETVAMMKLIDDIKPHFIYSLHNAGFGGAYWYISRDTPELYKLFHAVPPKNGVPLHMGEPESPTCVELAPAVYTCLGIKAEYDYLEKYSGADMKELMVEFNAGDCSAAYANEKYNSFTLLTELPYFYDPRIEDRSDSDMLRRDAVLEKTEHDLESTKELLELLAMSEKYLSPQNHYMLAIKSFSGNAEAQADAVRKMVESDPEFLKPATVAEKFDNLLVSRFYSCISYAMLVRANESELAAMGGGGEADKRAALENALEKARAALERNTAFLEENMNYSVVPIKSLVAVQLECGLLMADYLSKKV